MRLVQARLAAPSRDRDHGAIIEYLLQRPQHAVDPSLSIGSIPRCLLAVRDVGDYEVRALTAQSAS